MKKLYFMNGVKVNRGLHIPDPLLLDLSLTSGDNDTQRAAVTIEVHAKHASFSLSYI